MDNRSLRKERTGTVVSDRMEKTIVVSLERTVMHPKYRKYLKRRSRVKAHDETNQCHVGDRVRIVVSDDAPENFCRPSVNPLMRSAARIYGSSAFGIMLTGMGADGAKVRTLADLQLLTDWLADHDTGVFHGAADSRAEDGAAPSLLQPEADGEQPAHGRVGAMKGTKPDARQPGPGPRGQHRGHGVEADLQFAKLAEKTEDPCRRRFRRRQRQRSSAPNRHIPP